MNKSVEMNTSQSVSHYLPKIGKLNSEAIDLKHKGSLNTDRYSRTQSNSEINNNSKLMGTRKIVNLDGIRNVQEYDKMN